MAVRAVAAAVLALALPASASAATLDPLHACYVSTGSESDQRENIAVSAYSFAPESSVTVFIDGLEIARAETGTIGEFELTVDAPFQESGERPFTLEVRDPAGNSVITQSRVTNLAVFVRPRRSRPSRRVRFRGRGFLKQAPVYAHYLYGRRLRLQKTVRLARGTAGPCGTFSAKRRQIPIERPRTGRWMVQIDQNKAYSPQPDPVWVRLPIDVAESFLKP